MSDERQFQPYILWGTPVNKENPDWDDLQFYTAPDDTSLFIGSIYGASFHDEKVKPKEHIETREEVEQPHPVEILPDSTIGELCSLKAAGYDTDDIIKLKSFGLIE